MSEIQLIDSGRAALTLDLLSKIYSQHSLMDQGLEDYAVKLESGQYVSLGLFMNNVLAAHAGFSVGADFALINALAVHPEYRGLGFARELFDERIKLIKHNYSLNFIAGYAMTQHLGSQNLYGPEFKPIGLEVGYPDIYRGFDSTNNRGVSNAEIVLCQVNIQPQEAITVPLNKVFRAMAQVIFTKAGLAVDFIDDIQHRNDIFLGFHPNIKRGIFEPAFATLEPTTDLSSVSTSAVERKSFVEMIGQQL